jgi:glycosyltransferase involved in cell wall biosynthesis
MTLINDKSKIVISIIIPVFNTEKYLSQCLESILLQNLDLEIICIDNGSNDRSLEILLEYSLKHSNIRVLEYPEGRQGDARNQGLSIAKGKYIGFVDSDDYVHPNMFFELYTLLENNSAEIAICNIEYFYENSTERKTMFNNELLDCQGGFKIAERPWLLRNLALCNKLFSTNLIDRLNIKFPKGVLHEDQYFVAAAMLGASCAISTPNKLYFYRKSRVGSVSSNLGEHALDLFIVFDLLQFKMLEIVDNLELYNELKVARLIQLYESTKGEYRKRYFQRLKLVFSEIEINQDLKILTQTEYKEYKVLQLTNFYFSEAYFYIRKIYGLLRVKF